MLGKWKRKAARSLRQPHRIPTETSPSYHPVRSPTPDQHHRSSNTSRSYPRARSSPPNELKIQPKPFQVQDCLNHMMEFVKRNNLQPIFKQDLTKEKLEYILRPQAEVASQLPLKLDNISTRLLMQLTIVGLYDLVVLANDSRSMELFQGGKRKKTLKKILSFMTEIYGAVSGGYRGVRAIRFMNNDDDPTADNIIEKGDIDKVVDNHKFGGLNRIGVALMNKVLNPFVFADEPPVEGIPRKMRQIERPLLIMIIINGPCLGEDPTRVEEAIKATVDCLKAAGVGTKAVVFQFVQVGNDTDAEEYLRKLNEESGVAQYVHVASGTAVTEILDTLGEE